MTILLTVAAALLIFMLLVMAAELQPICDKRIYLRLEEAWRGTQRLSCFPTCITSPLEGTTQGFKKAIEGQKPDAVLIAGDMYTADRGGNNSDTASFVCGLAGKYPVYYGNGNHEHKTRLFPEEFGSMYGDYMESFHGRECASL